MKRILGAVFSLLLGLTLVGNAAAQSSIPPLRIRGSTATPVDPPRPARPGYLQSYTDPVTGLKAYQLNDRTVSPAQPVDVNYGMTIDDASFDQVFNADETYVYASQDGSAQPVERIFTVGDPPTYAGTVGRGVSNANPTAPFLSGAPWHPTNPNILYVNDDGQKQVFEFDLSAGGLTDGNANGKTLVKTYGSIYNAGSMRQGIWVTLLNGEVVVVTVGDDNDDSRTNQDAGHNRILVTRVSDGTVLIDINTHDWVGFGANSGSHSTTIDATGEYVLVTRVDNIRNVIHLPTQRGGVTTATASVTNPSPTVTLSSPSGTLLSYALAGDKFHLTRDWTIPAATGDEAGNNAAIYTLASAPVDNGDGTWTVTLTADYTTGATGSGLEAKVGHLRRQTLVGHGVIGDTIYFRGPVGTDLKYTDLEDLVSLGDSLAVEKTMATIPDTGGDPYASMMTSQRTRAARGLSSVQDPWDFFLLTTYLFSQSQSKIASGWTAHSGVPGTNAVFRRNGVGSNAVTFHPTSQGRLMTRVSAIPDGSTANEYYHDGADQYLTHHNMAETTTAATAAMNITVATRTLTLTSGTWTFAAGDWVILTDGGFANEYARLESATTTSAVYMNGAGEISAGWPTSNQTGLSANRYNFRALFNWNDTTWAMMSVYVIYPHARSGPNAGQWRRVARPLRVAPGLGAFTVTGRVHLSPTGRYMLWHDNNGDYDGQGALSGSNLTVFLGIIPAIAGGETVTNPAAVSDASRVQVIAPGASGIAVNNPPNTDG